MVVVRVPAGGTGFAATCIYAIEEIMTAGFAHLAAILCIFIIVLVPSLAAIPTN
jgi:hypothetical protein